MGNYVVAGDFVIDIRRANGARTITYAGPLGVAGCSRLAEAIDLCVEERPHSLEIDLQQARPNGAVLLDTLSSKAELCERLDIRMRLSINEAVREALVKLLSHEVELRQAVCPGSAV